VAAGDVDLCVTCYERTYRDVLAPGYFERAVAGQARVFARRTAVINNVSDRADAELLARALHERGELDAWFFVADRLAAALEVTGLQAAELGRAPYFADWGLVLVTVPGPDWFVHVDAEVRMLEPVDWVTPAIGAMDADRRVMVANPRWHTPSGVRDTLEHETLEQAGDFALGLGFSDQVFLARRSELAAPIYRQRCVAMRRYPMINVSPSFEARIDAWMRHHGRLRATYRPGLYMHPPEIGDGYPDRRLREKAQFALNRALLAAVALSPVKRRCWRAL
jgi:hypothetical protein